MIEAPRGRWKSEDSNFRPNFSSEIISAILKQGGIEAFLELIESPDPEIQRYSCVGLASMTLTDAEGTFVTSFIRSVAVW